MKSVCLAGEGRTELGGWDGHPNYRDPSLPGVVEALLHKLRPGAFEVRDAIQWKHIRKVSPKKGRHADYLNVLGAAVLAADRNCDALVFVRDLDLDEERHLAVEEALAEKAPVPIAGAVARPLVEAWLLALRGEREAESLSRSQVSAKTDRLSLEQHLDQIAQCDIRAIDLSAAASFSRWIARVDALP